jgi:hypothetical protein
MIRKAKTFPTTVPILEAADFCKGDFNKGETCCMIGWFREIFEGESKAEENAARENTGMCTSGIRLYGISLKKKYKHFGTQAMQALMIEAKRVDKDAQFRIFPSLDRNTHYTSENLIEFNDYVGRKNESLARVWNRAMARLGYVEGNPEAR